MRFCTRRLLQYFIIHSVYYSPFLLEHLSLRGAPLVIPTLLTPLSMMAQFIGEVPSESSSYSSSETSTGSELDIPAVKLKPDKSNETDPLPKVKDIGKENFTREIISLHETLGKVNYEETKQLFLNNVLMEALDDETPAYYNSNILGRYMRKDYGSFGRCT